MPEPALASPAAAAPADAGVRDNLGGAAWMLASCAGATGMSVAVRMLSDEGVPTLQTAFLRALLGLWVIVPVWLARPAGGPSPLRFTRPGLHIARGLLFVGALTCGFHALATLPLATATTLFFLAPVFATALSAALGRERVGPVRWAAVGVAFAGALVVLRPALAVDPVGLAAAVGSAACFGVSLVIARPLAQADGAASILVSGSVIAGGVLALPALAAWTPMGGALWMLVALLVLPASLRMYADVRAYAVADAGFLAPFSFLRLLFVAAAGWWLFAEVPDAATAAGAALIVGAAVLIALRSRA